MTDESPLLILNFPGVRFYLDDRDSPDANDDEIDISFLGTQSKILKYFILRCQL